MSQSEMILYAVKLILGGITALSAAMLFSKTKDPAWISLIAGFVTMYASYVYDLLLTLGIVISKDIFIAGIPLTNLIFTALPSMFFILAFAIMLFRK